MAHNLALMNRGNGVIQKLIVVDPDGDRVDIKKRIGSLGLMLEATGVDGESVSVHVGGEDLFALREFLTELPEEAFVRPADPIDASWKPGDAILKSYPDAAGVYLLQRGTAHWAVVGQGANPHWYAYDRDIDDLLAKEDPRVEYQVLRRAGKRIS